MHAQPVAPAPYALVVDDDGLIRMDVVDILTEAGFRTFEAETGDKAITLLEREQECIVLLFSDVQMPGSRNGFALARETAERWPHISIVIASGNLKPGPDDMPKGAVYRQTVLRRNGSRTYQGNPARWAEAGPAQE